MYQITLLYFKRFSRFSDNSYDIYTISYKRIKRIKNKEILLIIYWFSPKMI